MFFFAINGQTDQLTQTVRFEGYLHIDEELDEISDVFFPGAKTEFFQQSSALADLNVHDVLVESKSNKGGTRQSIGDIE